MSHRCVSFTNSQSNIQWMINREVTCSGVFLKAPLKKKQGLFHLILLQLSLTCTEYRKLVSSCPTTEQIYTAFCFSDQNQARSHFMLQM